MRKAIIVTNEPPITPLHLAINSFEGDTGLVKSLLDHDASQVNVRNLKDESPLLLALQNKRCSGELVELLLERGADVKATTARDGNTALHYWVTTTSERIQNRLNVAKILVRYGSDVNVSNLEGNTPLHLAINSFEGDTGLVKSLLEEDSSQVNVRNLKGESPLHLALQNKRFSSELIELLLEHGADVRATTARDGNTALHWLATSDIMRHYINEAQLAAGAAENYAEVDNWLIEGERALAERSRLNVAVAKILLRHGSDVNARNLEGESPLHSAIRSFEGDIRLVRYLLDHDVHEGSQLINARNLKDETPLHVAAQNYKCSEQLINLLLDHGADVEATIARNGNTPLHCWVSMDDIIPERSYQVAQSLLRHGSDVNARNLQGDTPLHLALHEETHLYAPIFVLLNYAGEAADVNAANLKGDTPLHLCLRGTDEKNLRLFWLFEKTTDINVVNAKGETPLHAAVRNAHRAKVLCVKMLLDFGADVGKKDATGENAYQAYCRAVDEDQNRKANPMLQMLLQPNVQQYMDSSLHVASLFHSVESVRKLLRTGADVNAVDESGFSPLLYALSALGDADKFSTVRLLLDYGADVNHQQFNRSDAAMVTHLYGYPEEASVLEAAMTGGISEFKGNVMENIFLEHLAKLFVLYEKRLEKGIDLEVLLSQYNRDLLDTRFSLDPLSYDRFELENSNVHLSETTREYYDCLSRCSEELKAISETEVGGSKLTFLDLLLASAKETATYAKNKELVKAFHAKKVAFPMYQGMLDAKLARSIWRRKLVDSAAAAMSDALRFADPSDEFFERTLSYCSNEDLVHVIEAMKLNTD